LVLEWELYPECINLFAESRLKTVKVPYILKNGKEKERTVVKLVAVNSLKLKIGK